MKSRNHIIWILGIVLGLLLLVALIFNQQQGKKRYNWRETYKKNQVQPYGTSVLFSLLTDFYPNNLLEESKGPVRLIDKWKSPLNYLALGEEIYYNDDDLWKLLEIVEEGNNALIVSKVLPYYLLENIIDAYCSDHFYYEYTSEEAHLNFKDSVLKSNDAYKYKYQDKASFLEYQWTYFDSLECDNNIELLGSNLDSLTNFVKIPYGDGNFFLHSTPLAFSNIQLLDEKKLPYVEKVFSYLPEATIYWDEHSKISTYGGGSNDSSNNSPLQYILQQDGLKWAWYLLLGLLLLYILSFGRRRQKAIPVIEQGENTSIEFTETIGELYYQQQNHRNLGILKMKIFLEYIRNHYFLNTNQIDEILVKKIITKSEMPDDHVNRLFKMYNRMLETATVSEYLLIEFNSGLENFYKNCK